jgi:hypothetical protein
MTVLQLLSLSTPVLGDDRRSVSNAVAFRRGIRVDKLTQLVQFCASSRHFIRVLIRRRQWPFKSMLPTRDAFQILEC